MTLMARVKPRPTRKLKYYLQGEKTAVIGSEMENKWAHYVNLPSKKQNSIEYKLRQQIKYFYNLSHTEYSLLLIKANSKKQGILTLIESRIDVLLCRLNFASSIFEARNLLTQGVISINNQVCLFPNKLVPIGAEIKIHPVKGISQIYKSQINPITLPQYLKLISINSAVLITLPTFSTIPFPLHIQIKKLPGAY